MSESSKVSRRDERRRARVRASYQESFGDPLNKYTIPPEIRKMSEEIDNECANLQDRIRKVSDSSNEEVGDDPNKSAFYVDQRSELVNDIAEHLTKARKVILEAQAKLSQGSQSKDLKRALSELDYCDHLVLKERRALAADRVRILHRIQGRPNYVKLGEAYLMAVTECLPEPKNAEFKKRYARSSADQTSFRHRLIKAYCAEGSRIVEDLCNPKDPDVVGWCPILEKKFDLQDEFMMVAAI
ncbi:hypothetical protein CLAIMM_15126 [Cladophialophora immunda]|nr:hypothetical protein CLAIMM_15126 [Cladophialophora immunda]